VTTLELTLNGIPATLRIPDRQTKAPIILWHGLGPPKGPLELMQALPLDEVPAVKIYLGLPLSGSRAPVESDDSLASRQAKEFATLLFQPVVLGAATELDSAVQALQRLGCIAQRQRIGLFGFSAGGTAALIALADRKLEFSAVVTLNAPIGLTDNVHALEQATGTRYQWTSSARDLLKRSDVIDRTRAIASDSPPPALLQVHGAKDPIVAGGGSRALYDELRPVYLHAGYPERLRLIDSIDATHNWTQCPALHDIQTAVADWFLRFLPDQVEAQ
jgi:predicted esterase